MHMLRHACHCGLEPVCLYGCPVSPGGQEGTTEGQPGTQAQHTPGRRCGPPVPSSLALLLCLPGLRWCPLGWPSGSQQDEPTSPLTQRAPVLHSDSTITEHLPCWFYPRICGHKCLLLSHFTSAADCIHVTTAPLSRPAPTQTAPCPLSQPLSQHPACRSSQAPVITDVAPLRIF